MALGLLRFVSTFKFQGRVVTRIGGCTQGAWDLTSSVRIWNVWPCHMFNATMRPWGIQQPQEICPTSNMVTKEIQSSLDVGLTKCRVCPWQFHVEHDFKNAATFHPSLYKISEPICSHTHSQGQHYPSKVITTSQQQSLHADWWIVVLQVCRIIISWIGGKNRTRSFWVPWRPVSVRSWGKIIGRNDVAILKWLEAVSHLSGLEGRDMFRHTFVLDVFW